MFHRRPHAEPLPAAEQPAGERGAAAARRLREGATVRGVRVAAPRGRRFARGVPAAEQAGAGRGPRAAPVEAAAPGAGRRARAGHGRPLGPGHPRRRDDARGVLRGLQRRVRGPAERLRRADGAGLLRAPRRRRREPRVGGSEDRVAGVLARARRLRARPAPAAVRGAGEAGRPLRRRRGLGAAPGHAHRAPPRSQVPRGARRISKEIRGDRDRAALLPREPEPHGQDLAPGAPAAVDALRAPGPGPARRRPGHQQGALVL
mmetsp:Transcript_27900/g.95097  ORF Transcript_27900/g.95097 Transcript_27900/m.95097 type:complete len:261 (+) Transcript_27900:244-1026(+)